MEIVFQFQKVMLIQSFNAAACIGCGACVAACKNASAMLFTSAKVSQYALLPQGQVERLIELKTCSNKWIRRDLGVAQIQEPVRRSAQRIFL